MSVQEPLARIEAKLEELRLEVLELALLIEEIRALVAKEKPPKGGKK
jgi:hypothetical protein